MLNCKGKQVERINIAWLIKFQIAAEVLGAHDDLHTFHEQISHLHKQYTEYVLGQVFRTPLREALSRFYETIVEFCLEAFSVVSKGPSGQEQRSNVEICFTDHKQLPYSGLSLDHSRNLLKLFSGTWNR